MARSQYPDVRSSYRLGEGKLVKVTTDSAGTDLANLLDMDNVAIAGSILVCTEYGLPLFQGPDGVTVDLYGTLEGAPDSFPIAVIGQAGAQTGNYTFGISDDGKIVEYAGAGAGAFTIPTHADVAFPVGTVISLAQVGAGVLTIVAAGGVTLNSVGGKVAISAQWAAASLRQRAIDSWHLVGSLA
jgi:hypothetical protein